MIFRHIDIDRELDFGYFGCIVIENPQFYRNFISSLFNSLENSSFSFIYDDKILNSNQINLISNPCLLDLNNRKIITAITNRLYSGLMSENFYLNASQKISDFQKLLTEIIYDQQFNFDISVNEPNIDSLIKSFSPNIDIQSSNFLDILYKYLEVMSEFTDIKLFVFLNLCGFMHEEEIYNLVDFCNSKEINIFTIENSISNKALNNITKMVVDEDLCIL